MVVCICSLIQNNSSSLRILARHVQTLIADPASPLTSPLTQHSGTHSQDRSSGKAAVVAGQKQKTQRSTPHPSESGRWDHHEPRLQAPGACSTVSATSLTKCKFKDKIIKNLVGTQTIKPQGQGSSEHGTIYSSTNDIPMNQPLR